MLLVLLAVGVFGTRMQAPPKHTWAAVMVEPVYSRLAVESLTNARYHIHPSIPIYIVTSQADRALFEAIQQVFGLQIKPFSFAKSASSQSYSRLLTSAPFWHLFDEDYILIFQADTRFCMGSNRRVQDFVGRFDYIGAPWAARTESGKRAGQCAGVGNGGFSLRNRTAMLDCTRWLSRQPARGNEDGLFVRCLVALRYRMPTCAQALAFAVEMYFDENIVPLAMHQAHGWNPGHQFFKQHCPEAIFPLLKG